VPLVISDAEMDAAGLTEREAKKELAIALFQQERFTLLQASRFAGAGQEEFQHWLAERHIPIHYGVAEFEQDIATLRGMGRY
jgi:predicted HTH domain antitoxin